MSESVDLDTVRRSDYGVHVEYLGNLLDVLIRRPGADDRFTLSMPDALDLCGAINVWVASRGVK